MFYVGQKVVCIDDRPSLDYLGVTMPVKDAIYTIHHISDGYRDGNIGLHLAEIPDDVFFNDDPNQPIGFNPKRFRPLVEKKKTDISIFIDILKQVEEKVKAG